jgi:ABC-2 type transport system ATP-binding protein
MEEVELLCQRVAIMDRGREVVSDSVAGLLAEHGGGSLEIEFRGDAGRIAAALSALGEVVLDEQGEASGHLRLVEKETVKPGTVVRAVEAAGGEVEALRVGKPSLETVFLALTGHSLRDEAR